MLQANGRTPEDSGAALAELLGFWPAGRMSPAVLQAAVERARHNPKAAGSTRSVAQRRSLDSTDASAVAEAREGSAEAARAPLPRHVPPPTYASLNHYVLAVFTLTVEGSMHIQAKNWSCDAAEAVLQTSFTASGATC